MLTADVDPSHKDSSGVLKTVCDPMWIPHTREGMLVMQYEYMYLSSHPTTTHCISAAVLVRLQPVSLRYFHLTTPCTAALKVPPLPTLFVASGVDVLVGPLQ